MRRLVSALVATWFTVAGVPAAAMAATSDTGAVESWAVEALAAPPRESEANNRLRLDVDAMNPRMITSDAADSVTITGKVTNIGDRRIDTVEARLQRGDSLTTEEKLRDALRSSPTIDRGRFKQLAGSLDPGQSTTFELTVPVTSAGVDSLGITEPGVYPILVNVNGQPDHGGRARLASLSTLLPVLALPGGQPVLAPATPASVTLLWPLADRPRLVQAAGEGGQAVLSDDDLATSFGFDGRLDDLLRAVEELTSGSPQNSALCLAIDPDLLETAAAMSAGYLVRTGDVDVPGKGANAARLWLARLGAEVRGRCVMSLPYADADLTALARAGQSDLVSTAVNTGQVFETVLNMTQPLVPAVWPADGVLDEHTQALLAGAGAGNSALLLEPGGLQPSTSGGLVKLPLAGQPPQRAIRIDPLVSSALVANSTRVIAAGSVSTPADQPNISAQDALGALVFRAAFQHGTATTVLVAPPRTWQASLAELRNLLITTQRLAVGRYATVTTLAELIASPTPTQSATLNYPVQAGSAELPPTTVAKVGTGHSDAQGLLNAMSVDPRTRVDPHTLIDPLDRALLRASSARWRGDPAAIELASNIVDAQITGIRGKVTVKEPRGPITPTSGDSPLPIFVENNLPVQVAVRIRLLDSQSIRQQPLEDQLVPAQAKRQVKVPAQVLRSGKFTVDVQLTTPSGTPWGQPQPFAIQSSVYGSVTLILTVGAAFALVLLSGRRIVRRIRHGKGGGQPEIDQNERLDPVSPSPTNGHSGASSDTAAAIASPRPEPVASEGSSKR